MNSSNEISLKQAIEQLLNSNPKMKDKLDEKKLYELWEKIMGKMIAKRTLKLTLKNRNLIVELDSASLRNELSFAKEKIISNINAEFGRSVIDEIKII